MHIKSVIIDGFKSYGKRVELKNFDPEFNAITGLNGSGKSNILDAICFTLGISTMNTIRAASIQDVIYKSGQAGIQTATVSIKFDNRDKSRSAPRYEHNDEIIISREVGMAGSKNLYKINGVTVPAKKVMDFFNSLQMNVNNPHFIIMQGRITKVLNMKPVEILSMVEEAAGTNMYESKKRSLEITVGKKDNKLREMRDVADEEILPTMISVDKEKQMLEELNMVQGQLRVQKEKLDNWSYVQLEVIVKTKSQELEALKQREKEKKDCIESSEKQIKFIKNQLKQSEEAMEKECDSKLSQLKKEVDTIEQEKNNIQLKVNGCKNNIKTEQKKIKDMEKQINSSRKEFEAKKKEMEEFNEINAGLDEENKKNTNALDEIDQKIRSLNSGNIFAEDDNGSVQENINKFNLELQNQTTENQQYIIKIDGLNKKLNEQLKGMKEAQKLYDKQMTQLAAKEKEYEKVKNEYLKAEEELSHHNTLRISRDSILREICDLNSRNESFESNNPFLFFRYNDPRPNFDRHKVHGLVCRLFKPIDFKFELALTTLAGGKLYFIVVEDDSVGKDILETNKFSNRMNFIPLSKIKSDSLPPNVIRIAQQIGGADNVFPAMSLIKYEKRHLKAIQWVFGQAFICTSKEIAEKVCFDSRVNRHCFTLEGDHFNPSGSLTGGANTQKLVLQLLASQDEITLQLQTKKSEFAQMDNRLTEIANLPAKVADLRDKQITVQEELEKIRSDVHLGQPHQQVTEVKDIKQQIAELEKKLAEGKTNEKHLQAKIKDLEIKMKNAQNILKQQLNDAEKSRKSILTKIKNAKAEYDKKKNNYNKLELEIKDLMCQMQEDENQLSELNNEKEKIEKDLECFITDLETAEKNYKEVCEKYEAQKDIVLRRSNEIEQATNKHKQLIADVETYKIHLLELEGEKKKMLQIMDELKKKFENLENRMPDDQKLIAKRMDYTNFNSGECKQLVDELQVKFDQLSKVVDPGKLNNFHKHIQEYNRLLAKLDLILKDKNKINEIIEELEVKKRQTLERASERVNLEFGKIFSSVLPGAQACLKQVNPNDITAGLEIRVAFNGLWKDSLEELSGGQRSLVALSLLLAMLLFNPVPLYILDEVDAALDLSHTQNIGKMLKQHFKQSQFIVVSLKDGMFSNANVLFRTKFVDGSSTVTRTTCNQL
ncbi:structural maintenance of chromosomes protein 2-like [Adelges cooleyi]|uniref:structural maintenance of chromosomes protein 2-like n=1 Tax=Adelges cooleyi TaxID=133065 RepID=UPI00217F61EB|nr:structural maintenance of chromosomes protein 2-like [Adelges cooleyi]XP_050423682.1 structural maintenance of chromosomes protein 2-like [Adelges cooleyi]